MRWRSLFVRCLTYVFLLTVLQYSLWTHLAREVSPLPGPPSSSSPTCFICRVYKPFFNSSSHVVALLIPLLTSSANTSNFTVLKFIRRFCSLKCTYPPWGKKKQNQKHEHTQNLHLNTTAPTLFAPVVMCACILSKSGPNCGWLAFLISDF